MKSTLSRRSLIRRLLAGALAAPVAGLALEARAATAAAPAAAPSLLVDPNDPTAKALGFVRDAGKVDAKTNPTYKAGQHCGSCAQFQGKAGETQAGCALFPGKQVPVNGWCRVWTLKPAAK